MTDEVHQRAAEWLARSPFCDGHADTFEHVASEGGDFLTGLPRRHLDLPRLSAAHQNLQIMAVYTTAEEAGPAATVRACRIIESALDAVERSSGRVCLVRTATDLDALQEGFSIMLSLEGADPLVGEMQMLSFFHRLGVRAIGLTHNHNSCAAGGCAPPDRVRKGLTGFGRELIPEMNRLGMVLDTAHLGRSAFDEALGLTTRPVINSHSCCRTIVDLERNLDDQQLRDLAATGGLAAVTFVPKFLVRGAPASSLDVFRHLEHMVEVAGIDHVAVGGDFDGTEDLPSDLRQPGDLVHLVEAMISAGWDEASVAKVLGGNWIRTLRSILSFGKKDLLAGNRIGGYPGEP